MTSKEICTRCVACVSKCLSYYMCVYLYFLQSTVPSSAHLSMLISSSSDIYILYLCVMSCGVICCYVMWSVVLSSCRNA